MTEGNGLSVLSAAPVASLEAYVEAGGGVGFGSALQMEPQEIVDEVTSAGLRGRGGAGFPTGQKWASVRDAAGDGATTLVCNAAEGEPGTFKDRALMRNDPYRLLEGVLIAMRALGAVRSVVATKRRYEQEWERLRIARDEMRAANWAGAEDIEILLGPDEYLFGEETALLEVIEGKLPMPRILPPYMYGLHGTMADPRPTAVNNVETLCHVANILAAGADAFRQSGTQEAPGTMVFTVIGDVENPGVYELPLGTPLRALLVDIAGATEVKAVYSGTSNSVITPDLFDLPIDFDSFRDVGSGLGSGGFIVYGQHRCIVGVVAALSRFLAVESCGQCPPCKLHGVELWERLEKLCAAGGTQSDLEELRRRCTVVTDANRCYLPVGHALVVGSALDVFADDFAAVLNGGCGEDRPAIVPKIVDIDDATGEVVLDQTYHRKRLDWSYAAAGEDNEPTPVQRELGRRELS